MDQQGSDWVVFATNSNNIKYGSVHAGIEFLGVLNDINATILNIRN